MAPDVIVRNLRIAFDPTVSRGTAMDAFLKLIEGHVYYRDAHSAMMESGAPPPRPMPGTAPTNPEFKDPTLTFGKHRGRKLSDIAKESPAYLTWMLENEVSKSEWFTKQARMALELYDAAGTPPPVKTPVKQLEMPAGSPEEDDIPDPKIDEDDDVPF